MSGDLPPAGRPALPELLEPALLDGQGLEVEAMRAAVRQRLFGEPEDALHIDRFVVLERLGSGGMGVVYLAEDPSLGRKVAIKLLHAERAGHADAQARLQREARALASLSHPNVVVVYEVGVYEGQLYLVMEHVAGQTLREWTLAHASDWRSIVAQYRAAGEGLVAAHRAGIIHRDFKPDNVLVDEDGRPRVLDFGLAAAEMGSGSGGEISWDELGDVDLTKTGTILGTPIYMSPEQFLGVPVDARTDQFSFCVALWEALFGERPFAGRGMRDLRSEVIAGRRRKPPSRSRVPRAITSALARGLATEPAQRFATMSELLQALVASRRSGRRAWISVGLASLCGLAVAAWLADVPAPSEPPPPSIPIAPAVAADVEPAVFVAVPEPELVPRRLTRTTGYGVKWGSIGAGGRVVTYGTGDSKRAWLVPRLDADAEPQLLAVPDASVVHSDLDGAYWLVDPDTIRRAWPRGATDRVIDRGEDRADASSRSWISPDGTAIAIDANAGIQLWDLRSTGAGPVRLRTGNTLWGMDWSPDASRIVATVALEVPKSYRLDVFDTAGNLQSSTPWPDAIGGQLLRGVVWLPSGLVVLVYDGQEAWVQCLSVTEGGLAVGPRSAGLAMTELAELVGASADRTLVVAWPELEGALVVLERSDEGVWEQRRRLSTRSRGRGDPVWRSETELAYLAAQPPGALVSVDVDDPSRQGTLAPGPFDWASDDGEGGIVLGPSDGKTIQYLARGATSPRDLQLSGIGSSDSSLRCRSPHDCIMSAADANDGAVLFGIDLERRHVRRLFECPAGFTCRGGRWGRSYERQEVFFIDRYERKLLRVHAETGAPLEEQPLSSWVVIQSVAETRDGELLLTGIQFGQPPEGTPEALAVGPYFVLRLDDDGEYRPLWRHDRTWVVSPRVSPSGRRLALDGFAVHADLVVVELGTLCDGPQ